MAKSHPHHVSQEQQHPQLPNANQQPPPTTTTISPALQLAKCYRPSTTAIQAAQQQQPAFTSPVRHPVIECTHWLEVNDKRHRYGSYLRPYYDAWQAMGSPDSFFSWLDSAAGQAYELTDAGGPRKKLVSRVQLERSRVRYCTERERERYRAVIRDGLLFWASDNSPGGKGYDMRVSTGDSESERWIFVIDRLGSMYINKKVKGRFHHSSFVSGAPVRCAGRIEVVDGQVVCIGPYSGHYRTTWEQLQRAVDHFFGKWLNVIPPGKTAV